MRTKPKAYHWHVYAKTGEHMTTCELRGGRDRAKRIRRNQAQWPLFGAFSRIMVGEYQPK